MIGSLADGDGGGSVYIYITIQKFQKIGFRIAEKTGNVGSLHALNLTL